MIFLESASFPDEWYLQLFFFLLPIIGLGAVADSVVRLAYLMFPGSSGSRSGNGWSPRSIATTWSSSGRARSATRSSRGCSRSEPVVAIERPANRPCSTRCSTWACR